MRYILGFVLPVLVSLGMGFLLSLVFPFQAWWAWGILFYVGWSLITIARKARY